MSQTIDIRCSGSQLISILELMDFQGNLKTLTDVNYVKLRESILRHGFSFPIFVWIDSEGDKHIIDGHQRVRVLEQMAIDGFTIPDIPIAIIEADNIRSAKAKLLAASSQYAEISNQGLYEYVVDQKFDCSWLDETIKLPGFDIKKFELDFFKENIPGNTEDDAVPEVDEKNVNVKLGDVWLLGDHRLVCGDSTDKATVDLLMNGEKAIFCFTSPPYSDQRDYSGNLDLDPKHLAKFLQTPCEIFAVNLGMKRKNGDVIQYWDAYIEVAKECGLKLLSWNIWDRSDSGYTVGQISAMFAIDHEWIFVFGKKLSKLNLTVKNKDASVFNNHSSIRQKNGKTSKSKSVTIRSHRQLGTVLKCNTHLARNIGGNHPAMFPVELPEEYIKACSNVSDIIFEPFGGSGSTLIACEKTNRKCFIMEIDPHYCQVIIDRWEAFTQKQAVKELNNDK